MVAIRKRSINGLRKIHGDLLEDDFWRLPVIRERSFNCVHNLSYYDYLSREGVGGFSVLKPVAPARGPIGGSQHSESFLLRRNFLYVLPVFFVERRGFLYVYDEFEQCVIECLRVFKLHSVRRCRNFGLDA